MTKRAVAPPFELPPPAPSTPLPWLLILSGVFRSSPLPPRRDMTCTWSGMLFGGKVSCEGGGGGKVFKPRHHKSKNSTGVGNVRTHERRVHWMMWGA